MGKIKARLYKTYCALMSPIRKQVSATIVTLSPNELLRGKTAVITGCTSGIGLAIAKAFLNAGASVVATGRDKTKLDKIKKELLALSGDEERVYAFVLDVMETDKLENAVDSIVDLTNSHRIDILVNNAGVAWATSGSPYLDYDIVMDTNLKSVYFISKIVAKHMIDNKIEGNILNIASSSSLRPVNGFYGLSKWGVRGITEGFAKQLIPYNIVVNGIGPGPTATPLSGAMGLEQLSWPENPSKRMATPEEVANLAVFLTSGMGRMIVGDIVYISGGAGVITCDDVKYEFK